MKTLYFLKRLAPLGLVLLAAVLRATDTTAPSTSTLTATTGTDLGKINLSWASAGNDGSSGNLTGYYRIQYATYTATWSTSTTPSFAFTSTITATGVSPGVVQSTTIVVSPTTYQPWYFVIWTQDDASNWSTISSTVSAYPPASIPGYGLGSIDVTSVGGGLSQGGTAWGDYDNDGDLDVVVSGTDGTNNQVRVYKSNGNGTFSSTVVNVAAANAGLKDGDVAFGDYDNDGDLDVLVSGTDGSNRQLRVYKNNGDATFNTTAVEVPGSANIGLSSGTVAWGDFDNDGDLDVLANGYDGTNNQLRVYKNKGDGTFDSTAINVAGLNSGLRQGGVAWGDYDKDGDLDILVSGTDGTNRQLRVYTNNGNGTFNSTGIEIAGVNNGLSDGRVAWGDFDKDGDLDVLVSGTDGTNYQLRTYANNGNGTFNSTPVNVAGSNLGVAYSGVAVGDFNVDGNLDVLAAGRPAGLVGYWKLDENTGTSAGDLSGNANTGTLTGGPTWVTGKFGKAVNLNGTSHYISVPQNGKFNISASAFTVSAWVQDDTAYASLGTYHRIVSWYDGTYNVQVGLGQATSPSSTRQYYLLVSNVAAIEKKMTSIASGVSLGLHHVVATFDGATYTLYVDGVASGGGVSTSSGIGVFTANSTTLYIGQRGDSAGWISGTIDDVRIFKRALSAGEVLALYQATKSSIGTLRIHKGVGDGTFNATPVEVDAGLEKGQVAWGDVDGDGDLDILDAGTDGSNGQLSVYLSTQSLTASNIAPSAPGTLAGAFSLSASGMSVASFTWTAGSDSGTGSTTENGLSYDIRISTKSDFSLLVAPGEEGASPRLGSFLKPPKIFSGNTAYGVVLKSTDPWNAHSTAAYGLRTDTTYYYQVKTVDAGLATSGWSASGTLNTASVPSSSTLSGIPGTSKVILSWASAGNTGANGTLEGNYRIQYATYTVSWSTASTPTDATTVSISTNGAAAGSMQTKEITGLTAGTTYYFALWSQNFINNWSNISNIPSVWAENDVVSPSTSTLSAGLGVNMGEINLSWASAGDDGDVGNLTGSYFIQYATYTATWSTTTTPTNATNVTISTSNMTPGSAQAKVITGLTDGTTYYFALWSQDESSNWSDISNTTSSWPTGDVTAPSTSTLSATVANVAGKINLSWPSAGDDGGSGNLTGTYRIQYATYTATWSTSSTPTNATTITISTTSVAPGGTQSTSVTGLTPGATYYFALFTGDEVPNWSTVSNTTSSLAGLWFNPTQIEVDGVNGGLRVGDVAWGDFDNDGDLDILVSGYNGANQLRVYKNNGNGTFDPVQIEVDGANGGLQLGGAAWGDFDNDGDLDILVNGSDGSNSQLRVYKNNGNGTFNSTQVEVAGLNGGTSSGDVAWGDFDNDGDLDILTSGYGPGRSLKVYKNNGNGTFDGTPISLSPGLGDSRVAWGDFDNDGDLDALAMGEDNTANNQIIIFKNNGNGTFNATPIYVCGSGAGLWFGDVSFADYDKDGDLDVLVTGLFGGIGQLRIYKNNGNGTFNNTPIEVESVNNGLYWGGVAWGDFDNDGDLDILVSGSDPSNGQLRVYKNNGDGTFDNTQIEVDGLNGGLYYGKVAWGDYDNDGDLDILVSGSADGGATNQLRVYTNQGTTSNTAPTAPGTLTSSFSFSASTVSVASFTWTAGSDSGAGASSENGLSYEVQISTVSNFGSTVFPGMRGASRRMGSYLKPPKIFNGNANYGVVLKSTSPWTLLPTNAFGLMTDTTYYYRVKTIDAGLMESLWSSTGTLNTGVSPSTSTIAASVPASSGRVTLTWAAAGDDGMMGNLTGNYRIQYATYTVSWSTSSTPTNATTVTVSTTNVAPGGTVSTTVVGLTNQTTYYFVLWSQDEANNWSNISNTTSAVPFFWFDPNQIEVDGLNGGGSGKQGVAWGDFDNDGDLDLLVSESDGYPRLRVYKNNGNGTMNPNQIDVDGATGGVVIGGVAWGDFDGDGDLDILVSGTDGATRELRVYKNNGDGTFDPNQIEVAGLHGGLDNGSVAWGDYDNDGDLDVLVSGSDGTNRQLRVYKNNGDGTFNGTPIDVAGVNGGLSFSSVAWGDCDHDGDLDILMSGYNGLNQLRVYKNNGDGSFNSTPVEVDGVNGGLNSGSVAWGDSDNDGDLDILVSGYDGVFLQLRVYKNNGDGTFDPAQKEVGGVNGGLYLGSVGWGDFDNDGDLDVLAGGCAGGDCTTNSQLRVYQNNGDGTFDPVANEVDGPNGGLKDSSVAWGDFDNDGDLDIGVSGGYYSSNMQLRIYKNLNPQANTPPTAPGTLVGGYSHNPTGVSIASFTWSAGSDSGVGATPVNVLTYDVQISTKSDFSPLVYAGEEGASPGMGSFLSPPKIFNSNTYYGVVLKSTDPWNAHSSARYGLRTDTTYYYRVKTVDAGLATSVWSASGTLNTGVSPSTSTIAASTTAVSGTVNLTWVSAGDDEMMGNLTGNYRLQYATYTVSWSTSSTPTDATTVTIATTSMVPGSAQSYSIGGLTNGTLYYFVLWSQDDVGNWSNISNTASATPVSPVTVTLAEAVGQPGWMGQGETQRILGTAQVVSDSNAGVTVSSVAVRETGAYTADGNLTNVEVWVSSSGYIDANAVRLENTAKAFSSDAAVFTQNITVSTTPLYFIARCDVSGSAAEGTFDITLQVYTTALTTNNPIAFSNATDVVAPPSGSPGGLTATAASNLLQVNLSWSGASGSDTYSIYRATYSGVTTTDFLLGITNTTSFADDYIPPAQQMYYKVIGTNRAGASGLSGSANATSVDVPALTTSNIYLRAGTPANFGDGNMAYSEMLSSPGATFVDQAGNVYIADTSNNRIRFIPKIGGTYFGQSMKANNIYTIGGNGIGGYSGDGGAAVSAKIMTPSDICTDAGGNVYLVDRDNHRIRFIPKTGGTYFGQAMTANYIYTIAGNGTGGYVADNVAATSTQINFPRGVSVDAGGNVYIADQSNHRIRFIAKTGGTYFGQAMTANYIYTIAGNGTGGYVADNVAATSTQMNNPRGVSVDAGGNVYIVDSSNHRIRFIPKTGGTYFGQSMTANYIYTIAGTGTGGYVADNVAATSTQINTPYAVSVDAGGSVFIADNSNQRIRVIAKTGGTYFGQSMTANYIYTIAGNGSSGYVADGVAASSTKISYPTGVSVDAGGNVYIADNSNNRVRFIPRANGAYFGQSVTANNIYTIAGSGISGSWGLGGYVSDGVVANTTLMNTPIAVSADATGNIYIADLYNNRVRFVPKITGTYFGQSMTANFIYTIAGTGVGGYTSDGVAATTSQLYRPSAVNLDAGGNVYIAEVWNNRIRFIAKNNGTYFGQAMTANYIYTIAGNGTAGYVADGVAATSTQLFNPYGVCVDAEGNVYISDKANNRVRFMPKNSGTYFGQSMTANYIYTIAGNGTGGYVADNVAATSTQIYFPFGISVDTAGNVYFSDNWNNRVRFIAKNSGTYFGQAMTANYIYTIAGNGTGGYLADNVAATSTRINQPVGLSVDAGGNVYIADVSNSRIRFIPIRNGTYFGQARTANYIYTIGGTGNYSYNGENAVATSKNTDSPDGVFAAPDHVVYISDISTHKVRMIAGEDFIAPSTSTLAVATGVEEATLSWVSAGDDNVNLGNLTGNYRIQYATYTAAWSTASTPTNATTVTLSTTNVVPGSAQSYLVTGLAAGPTYYFVLWTGDEVPNWSDISNTTSTIALAPIRSVTITSGNSQAFGLVMIGDQVVGTTGTVVLNDGTLLNTYVLRASTLTVGSPWQVMSSTPAGPDQLVLYGVFDGASAPVLGDFAVDDVIGPVNRDCTSAQFSVAGSTTGVGVPAGQSRTFWLRLDAPTTSTTVAGQAMKVEITAQPP